MKVIIDCDPGNGIPGSDIDDALAIAVLAGQPDVELLGVTIVAGNTAVGDGYASAHQIMSRLGVHAPIVAGAWRALTEDPEPWIQRRRREGHEELLRELWSDVEAVEPREAPHTDDAAGFIIEQAHAHPGEVVLVAVGPLTNVAAALQRDESLPGLLREVVVMGGAFDVPSNPQELNFAVDPEAARLVVRSRLRLSIVPLDVTLQSNLVQSDMDAWGDSPAARYLRRTTAPWISYMERARGRVGCPLHDPLAAVLLIDDEIGRTREWSVDVELAGTTTRARPVRWPVTGASLADGVRLPQVGPTRVLETVDNGRLLNALAEAIKRLPGGRDAS